MGAFDSLVIEDETGTTIATVARVVGPLEAGSFDDGVWQLNASPTRVDAVGFGITAGGVPYFSPDGAEEGEVATLWVDGTSNTIWLAAE